MFHGILDERLNCMGSQAALLRFAERPDLIGDDRTKLAQVPQVFAETELAATPSPQQQEVNVR